MELDQQAFSIWLFNQPKDRVIEAAHMRECFLCSFLKETVPLEQPAFTWAKWIHDVRSVPTVIHPLFNCEVPARDSLMPYTIPDWATKLINAWDLMSAGPGGSVIGQPITCGQMQARYCKLFGDPRKIVPSEPMRELAGK